VINFVEVNQNGIGRIKRVLVIVLVPNSHT